MANNARTKNQFRLSIEPSPAELFANIAIGSSGASTITRAKGVVSVTHNSAGRYTLLLQEAYVGILDVHVQQMLASGNLAAPIVQVISADVTSAAQTVVILCKAIDGTTATDPGDGTSLMIRIAVRTSTAPC